MAKKSTSKTPSAPAVDRAAHGSPIPGWNEIATIPPPVGVEVLVCREGVDANTKGIRAKDGKWTISEKTWCQIEANAIKAANRGRFKPTHWWYSANV